MLAPKKYLEHTATILGTLHCYPHIESKKDEAALAMNNSAITLIPQPIKAEDAAQRLGCSISTSVRMIKDRQIDGLPIRSKWFVPVTSIQEYIATRTLKAKTVRRL